MTSFADALLDLARERAAERRPARRRRVTSAAVALPPILAVGQVVAAPAPEAPKVLERRQLRRIRRLLEQIRGGGR